MSSLLIYPFCREFSDFARCVESLKDYDKIIPISPKGFGFDEEDINVCDGGDVRNLRISADFDASIKEADAAFFGYTISNISTKNYIDKINIALALNKKVFVTQPLMEFLGDMNNLKETELVDYNKVSFENELTLNLLPISVPVIVIIGIGDYCDKFSIQVKLKEFITSQGYQVMNCGSKNFSNFFNMESLPQFLFEPMDNGLKIRKFNNYLYNRVKKEKPDIVIIGVPGGVMQTNPFKFDEFGEMAFIISNAVKADLSILSVYKQEFTKDFIDHLLNICKYKYNFHVNFLNIANTDFYISPDDKDIQFTTVPSTFIMKNIIQIFNYENIFLFNALNDASMKEACEKILNELEENR